jgi:hypothetical protein
MQAWGSRHVFDFVCQIDFMTTSSRTESEATLLGVTCRGCNHRLPLRASQADETAALWECANCRSPFAGVLLTHGVGLIARRVRLADLHFDSADVGPISHEFRQFVRKLDATQLNCTEKFVDARRSVRIAEELDVVAVGIDAGGSAACQPVPAIVVNLSGQGMLLMAEQPFQCERLVVRLLSDGQWLQIAGRVIWARELEDGFHGAGVEFIARLATVRAESRGASTDPN